MSSTITLGSAGVHATGVTGATMTTPRQEYESTIDDAITALSEANQAAHQRYSDAAQHAWYNYQIRTGMIPVPDTEQSGTEHDDDTDQASSGGGSAGDDAGIPGNPSGPEPDDHQEGRPQ